MASNNLPRDWGNRTVELSGDRSAVIEVADGRVELLVVGERMAASVALERHESRAVAVAVLEASQRILEED